MRKFLLQLFCEHIYKVTTSEDLNKIETGILFLFEKYASTLVCVKCGHIKIEETRKAIRKLF